MRITRLRVAELRQFRVPFQLDGLAAGLNILTGSNEAGKSTLVRAIRAAFFERHRSTAVDDLRPYGDTAAAPQVEIDFDINGVAYRLRKQFLHKKRCELVAGAMRYEGAEAEDHLAERLGFEFAAKGASREALWGIPGLLWIEQGAAQDLHGAVDHAASHLQQALDGLVGEVASSAGDDILAQVRRLRDELLTPGSGKPRATYQRAIEHAEAASAEAATLEQARRTYQQQVDQLMALRQAHRADTATRPWLLLRQQQQQATEAWQAAQALGAERTREQERLAHATGWHQLIAQRLADAEQQRRDLARREATLHTAQARRAAAQARHAAAQDAEAQGAARLAQARLQLDAARLADTRRHLQTQQRDASERLAEIDARLAQAEALDRRARDLGQQAAALRLDPRDLKALRTQSDRLAALGLRQEAEATRLRFSWAPGTRATLGGTQLPDAGERPLGSAARLEIAGVGWVDIVPGSAGLAELAQEAASLRSEHQTLLQRLGLSDAADAHRRDLNATQRQADAEIQAKALDLVAPRGLDALRAERAAAQARQTEAQAALGRLPEGDGTKPALPLQQAELAVATLQEAATLEARALQQAREALAVAEGQVSSALLERDALREAVDSPTQQAEWGQRQAEATQAAAQVHVVQQALAAVEARLAAVRPDILKQDIDRFSRSADEAERAHQARERQLLQLEATLAAQGAQGLDEQWAAAQAASEEAAARRHELERRARALDYLLQRLESKRQAVTQRLQAPLQQRMDHYLALLLPHARFEIGHDLRPQALTRPADGQTTASPFDSLSFGAREQLGVLARLAYADLLKTAGRPTLLILDDALVHSDEQRLAQMKRVLFDAATRHQVLLFTCHPERWRDMGVPLRALGRPEARQTFNGT